MMIVIIIITTLATDTKCSDLEAYDCKSQFRKDVHCTSHDAGKLWSEKIIKFHVKRNN